jgi:hypothetical protein
MAFSWDRRLIAVYGVTLAIIILVAIAFIVSVGGECECMSPSPVISAYPVMNVASGTNITVSGQNFTPNGIAVLYGTGIPESYTANVDHNGNISFLITQAMLTPYQIYALDENSTIRKSNTITIYPLLNDAPRSAPVISAEPVVRVVVGTNITVTGQNFAPNGTAVLYSIPDYGIPSNHTANVDQNGNIVWSFTNGMIMPYTIYALDENSTSRQSNNVSIYPMLNDATPSTTFSMVITLITLIATGAAIVMVKRPEKK